MKAKPDAKPDGLQTELEALKAKLEALQAQQAANRAGRTIDVVASVPKPDTPAE